MYPLKTSLIIIILALPKHATIKI